MRQSAELATMGSHEETDVKTESARNGTENEGSQTLDTLGEPRRSILIALKRDRAAGVAEIAERNGITYEAARQQLGRLEADGWIARQIDRSAPGPGRPRSVYHLTAAGDHLFPKEYDELAVALIDAAADRLGPEALHSLLEEIASKKVEQLLPQIDGKSLDERLAALRNIYKTDDPFCRVEYGDGDEVRLVEMNCPYLEVAKRRPALCSVTVSVLRRLLQRDVVRTERFQAGDGRCVFTVLDRRLESVSDALFAWEPENDD